MEEKTKKQLMHWFLSEKRDLPWRNNPSPYAVWISEVMLQQTQVAVVIPYFHRWMDRFPTIQALAEAHLDEVIKLWEGLGYYSRARNLHEGAKYIVRHFGGELPDEETKLQQIKGLGPYTIGAILSFAFHQRKAAVDGNVLRVLTRYFQIEENIQNTSTLKKLRELAESILPKEESWIFNEALIELGAVVCQKKAKCGQCPLNQSCLSFQNGKVDLLPIKNKSTTTQILYRAVAVIACGDVYLVQRGVKGKVMSDLYEFPFFETAMDGLTDLEFQQRLVKEFKLKVTPQGTFPKISHSFTRYQAHLSPVLFTTSFTDSVEGFHWIPLAKLKELPFSSGHRRLLHMLK